MWPSLAALHTSETNGPETVSAPAASSISLWVLGVYAIMNSGKAHMSAPFPDASRMYSMMRRRFSSLCMDASNCTTATLAMPGASPRVIKIVVRGAFRAWNQFSLAFS